VKQKQLEKKKKKREEKKKHLMAVSKERTKARGAPDFGIQEGDALALKSQVQKLTVATNNNTAELEEFRKLKILDKIMESNYMCQVILKLLVDNNLVTEEKVHELCRAQQMKDAGLVNKPEGSIVEKDDVLIMVFQLFDTNGKLVDDQTKNKMAYKVGSGGLPCDDGLEGMQVGESRSFEVNFGEGLVKKELVGKQLLMNIKCLGIQQPNKQVSS
jgi:hypothetical protein